MTQQTILRPSTEQERRTYLLGLLTGVIPDDRPTFGDLEEVIDHIVAVAHMSKGDVLAIKRCIDNLSAKYPDLRVLVKDEQTDEQPDIEVVDPPVIPPLPEGVALPRELGRGACRWLDEYEAFSKTWSPRGYEYFHAACGIWILSSVALRRVYLPLGPGEYTPLFICLNAPTTGYAKSTTASIAKTALRAAGLGWMLAPDTVTPQKFLSNLSGRLPSEYDKMTFEQKQEAELRYAFSGQVSWLYDEFGQQMDGMASKNGIMADFKGILRRLDDCDDKASNDTLKRGLEIIDSPYMALLASMTPSDARPYAGKGASFWRDGFFARFTFVGPHPGEKPLKKRFPEGVMSIPTDLTAPLLAWHKRLGKPDLTIQEEKDTKGNITAYNIIRGDFPRRVCQFGRGVIDAYYCYSDALGDLVYTHKLEDLAGNYGRMAAKALRMAALFASLENNHVIEMRHWAKAQEIAENWRACLHHFEASLAQNSAAQAEAELEALIIEKVKQFGPIQISRLKSQSNSFKGIMSERWHKIIDRMLKAGDLERVPGSRSRIIAPNPESDK